MEALCFYVYSRENFFSPVIKCGRRRELLQFFFLHALIVNKKTFAYPELQFASKIVSNAFKTDKVLKHCLIGFCI
jgi:hypothetical protein